MPLWDSDYGAVGAALATHAALQLYEFKVPGQLLFIILSNIWLYTQLQATPKNLRIIPLQVRINMIYFGSLLLSIVIYRRFFHRLHHFPGPFWASITKFWAFITVNKGQYFQTVKELHEKHGDFVRVGPREIDVCNLSAIDAVFGSATPCVKGSWYDGLNKGDPSALSIMSDRSAEGHTWRRRIWDVAFTSKALREYEPRVAKFVNKLIESLERERVKGDGIVDIGMYFSFFTFDVMGDLAFGESFYMLENGESHDYMKIVQNFAQASALIGTIPWIVSFFPWLPKLEGVEKLFRFTKERVTARIPLGDIPTDIFSYLLREDRVTKRKYTQMELNRECVSLVIGGSDTTSSALTTTIYYLLTHPDKYARLKREIDVYDGPLGHPILSKFDYLNAIIKECLRLLPPIRAGMNHRQTPPEGITIEGTYIPGNVNIGIGSYEIQHDPRYWAQPDEFIPERWIGEGPEPAEKTAFFAFSYGPYTCVGKHLAYIELRYAIAALTRAFDIELDPKYNPASYKPSVKDVFTSSRAYLPVVLKLRVQE